MGQTGVEGGGLKPCEQVLCHMLLAWPRRSQYSCATTTAANMIKQEETILISQLPYLEYCPVTAILSFMYGHHVCFGYGQDNVK